MAARFTKPYVDALFEVAGSPRGVELLLPGLDAFAATLGRSDELRTVLRNPGLPRDKKNKLVEEIGRRDGNGALGLRLLTSLLSNHRLHHLDELLKGVRERLDRERRVVEATLKTAAPLDAKAQSEIRETLEKKTKMSVRLVQEVDPALLGGFVVRLGSEIYDASLSHRLDKARRALHTASAVGSAAALGK
jgi:F-type H+-transporting ATPase subunit delta